MRYLGPTAPLSRADALALADGWATQPKIDGCYAVARTDATGRICSVVSRTGRELPEGAELHGILAGPPASVLVGELEAHTEAGAAAYARQGYRRLHLFDCLALDGTSIAAEPYLARWGALHRAQSILEADGAARVAAWRDEPGHRRVVALTRATAPPQPRARDLTTGRMVRRIPHDLRCLPIIPLHRGHAAASELWREVEAGRLEGLVAVRLDAPAGARVSKRKCKLIDTIDARVLRVTGGVALLAWAGGTSAGGWARRPAPFEVPARPGMTPGAIVEVAHDGWYGSGVPRFARALRVRTDLLSPAGATVAA